MSVLGLVLLVVLILLLVGVSPGWPHTAGWGYGPPGIVTFLLVILLVLVLLRVV